MAKLTLIRHFKRVFESELKKRRIIPDSNIKINKPTVVFPSVLTVSEFSGFIEIKRMVMCPNNIDNTQYTIKKRSYPLLFP